MCKDKYNSQIISIFAILFIFYYMKIVLAKNVEKYILIALFWKKLTFAITVITITVYFPRYIAPANFAEKENNPKIKAAKVV